MKRLLLLISFLTAITGMVVAQSLVLYDSVAGQLQPLAPNATIAKQGTTNVEVVKYLAVKNTASDSLHVMVKKEHVNVLHNTINMFCWGLCFSPDVYVSPWSKTIKAGETNAHDFSGHYVPGTETGVSVIRYTFFVKENPNDSVSVTVEFSAYPLGVGEAQAAGYLSEVYPNPVSSKANFNVNLPGGISGELIIRNLLGSKVIQERIDGMSGKLTFNTQELKDGLYFYTLVINGDAVLTRKMVVRH